MSSAALRSGTSPWRRHGDSPLVLGHRGARREATENTLEAFRIAVDQGAAGVELDVRLDADGELIVLHDRSLERVTAGRDPRDVELLSRAERAQIRLDGGQPIPTLREALEWAIAGNHLVNVELKRDVLHRRRLVWRVAKLLRAMPAARSLVLLSSFDPSFVRALAWLLPDVPTAWLVHAKQRLLSKAPGFARLGAVGVHPELALATNRRVQRWLAAGALVNVWTVNEASEAVRLADAGVDAIISDVPGEIVSALRIRSPG